MKKRIAKYIYIIVALSFGLLFVARFGGPAILKAYVETGIGGCQKTPLLCVIPDEEIINPKLDKARSYELLPYVLPGIEVSIPKGFTVIKGKAVKGYYKNKKFDARSPVIYLLYQDPGFFPGLFPHLKKQGVTDNYEFVNRTMRAQPENIKNITDAFFVIMKSVFTPNLGEPGYLRMVKFTMRDKRGFITYNLTPSQNYFDCDVIDKEDPFFKIYIKDKDASLNLDKVLAIVSTLKTSTTLSVVK